MMELRFCAVSVALAIIVIASNTTAGELLEKSASPNLERTAMVQSNRCLAMISTPSTRILKYCIQDR